MIACIHTRCVISRAELVFGDGVPRALGWRVPLQRRSALVPAGVSEWVIILEKFLCQFLAGGSCHVLRYKFGL